MSSIHKHHHYSTRVRWTGNTGSGTCDYRAYEQTKEEYLESYMAKNLYMLECPVSSEYNMESATAGKTYTYIRLLPLDYFAQDPHKEEEKRDQGNTTWVTYKTNNAGVFWEH